MTFRGFVAVDVPSGPRLDALAGELRKATSSLKVVRTDQLHLTLKFLGETEEGLVPEIVTAMREAAAEVRPFDARIRGTGAFPSLQRMNVVWVGVEGAEPLARMAEALDASLEPLGFARERRTWTPHVTLARAKGRRDLDPVRAILQAHSDEDFGTCSVGALHLKKSVLTPGGAQYSIVETLRLPG